MHPEEEECVDDVDEVLAHVKPQQELSLDRSKESVLQPLAHVGELPFPMFSNISAASFSISTLTR